MNQWTSHLPQDYDRQMFLNSLWGVGEKDVAFQGKNPRWVLDPSPEMSTDYYQFNMTREVFQDARSTVGKQPQDQPELGGPNRHLVGNVGRQPHGGGATLAVHEDEFMAQVESPCHQLEKRRVQPGVGDDPVHAGVITEGVSQDKTQGIQVGLPGADDLRG